ncbi:MAG: glutamate-5-semialdehyde dehydrogenase [Ignavibacteriales bacterium]
MEELIIKGEHAKQASRKLAVLNTKEKDYALEIMAEELIINAGEIISANIIDVENASKNGMKPSLVDRLMLNKDRIDAMAQGLQQIKELEDPVGEIASKWERPNGIVIAQQRVPIGVIGMIYESRPNVTVDSAGLCIKAGNAVILRGGSEALLSNKAIVKVLNEAIEKTRLPNGCIQLVEDTNRDTAAKMMKLNKYIDVLIPRGGAGLIQTVVQNATVPVIETGTGNCHVFVDRFADFDMAEKIIINAKTSRPGVCNAIETLLIEQQIADSFLPRIYKSLADKKVEIRGCEKTCAILLDVKPATEDDYYTEFLDLIIAIKVVKDIEEAIEHINHYGTRHSEAIITSDAFNASKFQNEVDAAAVYVNASTRFTDGFEFGFGAEIGISTQKLHARGPIGLKELTTLKYVINGNGQIR